MGMSYIFGDIFITKAKLLTLYQMPSKIQLNNLDKMPKIENESHCWLVHITNFLLLRFT